MSIKEYCGLFGLYDIKEAAYLTTLGLFALQHRGEESAGIVVSHEGNLFAKHGLGLVSDVFPQSVSKNMPGRSAIGHVRYSTAGGGGIENCQPFLVRLSKGEMAIAHNGTLTNAVELKKELEKNGAIFRSSSDTEVILHLFAQSKSTDWMGSLKESLRRVSGAYSLLFLTKDTLVAVRDPLGFRPLVLGKKQDQWVVASETCALDMVEATYIREVEPGEIVTLSEKGIQSDYLLETQPKRTAPCVFEHIYFARPDSVVFSRPVYESRKQLGRALAKLHPVEADVVIPVPDSGVPAAIGYSEQSGIPFDMALTRSHYVGRSFIQPEQEIRTLSVRLKLATATTALKDKRVIVVDDSLVRGTTSRKIVKLLRAAGAKEVHLRISAPPTIAPCFYGIDMPSKKDLIAAQRSVQEIQDFVTADSLGYLTIEATRAAVDYQTGEFCEACFTEEDPLG